jgi:hypothetical protein
MTTAATWPTKKGLGAFVIQSVISTIGASLIGIMSVAGVAVLTAAVTRNTSGGNFIDHVVEQPSFILLNQPYFVAPVLAGFILGILSHRFFQSRTGAWVWSIPALILVWNLLRWENGNFRPNWPDVWANFFSSQCSSSECLYEVFVTTPFYTSVAYALGWLAKSWVRKPVVDH